MYYRVNDKVESIENYHLSNSDKQGVSSWLLLLIAMLVVFLIALVIILTRSNKGKKRY